MAKRFTDTAKWKDSWYQDLPTKYKLFWVYLLDECDASGVWKPNIRLANFQIGEPFEEAELKRVFGDRLEVIENGYWFVKKFIEFQYGELSENCKPHLSVLNLLKNHKIKGYAKGIHTLKEKEKDKVQDKDQVKEKEEAEKIENWNRWGKQILSESDQYWEQMKGRKITQPELDSFYSVAIRNEWGLDTQQKFRIALHGFKVNGTEKARQPREKAFDI